MALAVKPSLSDTRRAQLWLYFQARGDAEYDWGAHQGRMIKFTRGCDRNMDFEYLADRPELVPLVIKWWHSIWADRMGDDLDAAGQQLGRSLHKTELPIHILACRDGQAVGTAALKLQELGELFPDRQYWLGSVFVENSRRGEGIASLLSEEIATMAADKGLPHLYLQTADLSGGLYARLGWEPVELFRYRGEAALLMVRKLNS